MRSLTWEQVWARRLARHALLAPAPMEHLIEVVRGVCGIHAQVISAAELSLGIRVAGLTRRGVQAALWEQRRLAKTYGLRGTVHLFPADELPLWLAALRASQRLDEQRRQQSLGLGPARLAALLDAIRAALDGRRLTRDELGQEVTRRAGAWAAEQVVPAFGGRWPRWQAALGPAARAGILCFGPNQGAKVTFVRPDQWLPGWKEVDGAAALDEVVRRYVAAYGPATARDLAAWQYMQPSTARAVLMRLATAGELELVDVEGQRAWLPASDAAAEWPPVRDTVHLLPHFDCYLIGCRPRVQLVPEAWAARALVHGSAATVPALLVNGVVAGRWELRRGGRQVEVRVEAFGRLTAGERRSLARAAARVGAVCEAESRLILGPVTAHPHL